MKLTVHYMFIFLCDARDLNVGEIMLLSGAGRGLVKNKDSHLNLFLRYIIVSFIYLL